MIELVLFFLGLAIGATVSWGIAHRYYVKASADQEKQFAQLLVDLGEKNTIEYFRQLLEESDWEKEYVDSRELWISQSNNIYQIERGERGERGEDFSERWTEVHPNPNSACYPVYLRIGHAIIKELSFIAVDEGRIFVPMPEQEVDNDERRYSWSTESLEVSVCQIVGKYHIYHDLTGVAKRSGVELVP